MDGNVWVAIVGLPSGILLGSAALITALRQRKDIQTNHGKKPGEYIEQTAGDVKAQGAKLDLIHENQLLMRDDMAELRMLVWDHVRDRELHRTSPQ